MRSILFVFCLAISICVSAQNELRFVPAPGQTDSRSTSQTGHIKGGQITKSQVSQVHLPTGEYLIHWRRSEIKQYDRIFTDDGWIPSSVDLWEGYSSDGKDRFIATTIDGKINSMRWSEKEEYFQLIRLDSSKFEFSIVDVCDKEEQISCDFDQRTFGASNSGGRMQSASCQMVEFGIVTDLALRASEEQVLHVESKMVEWFAHASTFFHDFDVDLNFRIKRLIIPLEDSPFPPGNDPSVTSMGDVNYKMKNWLAEKGFPTSMFDLTVGISNTGYPQTGYGGYTFGDQNSVATIVMRTFPSDEQTKALLLHELGHGFGAAHEIGVGYIMSPIAHGGRWSPKNKSDISAFVQREDMASFFQDCQRFVFDAFLENGAVKLIWESTYEYNIAYYVLVLADVGVLDTISAIGKENEPVSYEFIHKTPALERNIYRIYQYSIYDELVASANIAIDLSGAEAKKKTSYGPNPFREKLHIELGEPVEEITIYDISGRIYLQQKLTESTFDVATGAWKQGLYFFNVDGEVYKIIKQ